MVKRHGRQLRAWVAGYRISPDIASIDESYSAATAQITSVEEDDHTYVSGQRTGEIRMTGFFDDADNAIDDIMSEVASLGTENNDILIVRHTVQGAQGYAAEGGLSRNYDINAPLEGAVGVNAAFLISGEAKRVLVASGYQTVSAAGTVAASLDLGAGSAPNGAQVFMQCDSISGTVTVEVFHGASNLAETTSFGSVTFVEGTGRQGTVLAVEAGAVARYITAVWTPAGGGGTASFITAIGLTRGTT